jgi:hypothetical protein
MHGTYRTEKLCTYKYPQPELACTTFIPFYFVTDTSKNEHHNSTYILLQSKITWNESIPTNCPTETRSSEKLSEENSMNYSSVIAKTKPLALVWSFANKTNLIELHFLKRTYFLPS